MYRLDTQICYVQARHTWWVFDPYCARSRGKPLRPSDLHLDVSAMQEAASCMLGTHDFTAMMDVRRAAGVCFMCTWERVFQWCVCVCVLCVHMGVSVSVCVLCACVCVCELCVHLSVSVLVCVLCVHMLVSVCVVWCVFKVCVCPLVCEAKYDCHSALT